MEEAKLKEETAEMMEGQADHEEDELAPERIMSKKYPLSGMDAVFAVIFFAAAWLYWDLILFHRLIPESAATEGPAGLFWFSLFYTGAVLGYLAMKKKKPAAESWFWLAVLIAQSLSLVIFGDHILMGALQVLAIHGVGIYWTVSASGRLLENRTSHWVLFDVLNAGFIIPWGNFLRLPAVWCAGVKAGAGRIRGKKEFPLKKAAAVCGGILAALACLCVVIPLLSKADSSFKTVISGMSGWLTNGWSHFWSTVFSGTALMQLVLALFTGMFLYGLVYGCVSGRRAENMTQKSLTEIRDQFRFAPAISVILVLAVLTAVYIVFLLLQAGYLFGAFFGNLPEGFSYAEYARTGFFELCQTVLVNGAVLLAINLAAKKGVCEGKAFQAAAALVCAATLLLIVTAASKMGLYITVYGLTVKRVLVSVFLLWLAIVFISALLLCFRRIPLVRVAAFSGAVLFTLLCILPVEKGIQEYNSAGNVFFPVQPCLFKECVI